MWFTRGRSLLLIAALLERQVVEVLEEAWTHVLILTRDLETVRFSLVGDFEHDEVVFISELDF